MKEMGATAHQILDLLRRNEAGMTVEELCQILHVTPMAVHRPVTALEQQGFVRSELLHQSKKGRPLRIYKIAEQAEELYPKTYGHLLLDFLQQLGAQEGIRRIRKLFEARFKRTLLNYKHRMAGKDLSSRVQILSELLNEQQYMTEQKQNSRNEFEIKLMNCPISRVAKEYPEACRCEQRFLSDLLDANVTREHHILNGQNYCSYVIRRK